MTDQAIVDAVRHSRLATELSDAQMRTLADSLVLRDLQPDEVLVKEGKSDNHLYVIVNGAIGVVRNAGTTERVTLLNPDLRVAGELLAQAPGVSRLTPAASLSSRASPDQVVMSRLPN